MPDSMPLTPNAVVEVTGPQKTVRIGNELPVAFLAGPCAMEGRDHALYMADNLKQISEKLGVGLIYKTSYDKANRTSISGYRGLPIDEAMRVFEDVRNATGLPVVTDVHTEEQCAIAGEVVDVLQIPAYLCRQTDLLLAAAKTGKAINVKKGQFLAPWDMKNVIQKVVAGGNPNVMACERGVSFGYNTLVTDMRALPEMRSIGCPVVFDATHSVQQPGGKGSSSGGQREMVPVLAAGASAIGIAAVFMEVHQDPDTAPSDGANMVRLDQAEKLISRIMAYDALAKKFAREDA
ncbi:MAG: 3-deoxy-8-phosphooctulonate synthase [Henriciella sp.]|jgi:2-dehydro-3-deoxyphosphooctonate aldolase (KDO 8-P synthase)